MKEENINKMNLEEPSAACQFSKLQQGISKDFDFEKEFANGLTVEEAKKLSKSLIREWWKKDI